MLNDDLIHPFDGDEERAFRHSVRRFADTRIAPLVETAEETGDYPLELLRAGAQQGLLGLSVPEDIGGQGAGITIQCIATEEMARVCAGLATGLNGFGLHLFRYVQAGPRERFLSKTLAGEAVGGLGISEADAGSDVYNIKSVARRTASGWHLQGTKMYITKAPIADYLFLLCYTDRDQRRAGMSLFIVDAKDPGVEIRPLDKLGHKSVPTGAVFFDVEVGPEALVGEVGQGMSYIGETLEAGRVNHSSRSLGVAIAAYLAALSHAQDRVTFGKPITEHQAVQFKLSRMLTTIRSAGLHVYDAARQLDQGVHGTGAANMAKLTASEAAITVCQDAMQICAGQGYMSESPVQRFLRDAYLYPISEGTTEIQLRNIANVTGIRRATPSRTH